MVRIFLPPRDTTKGMLFLLHLGLESVAAVDTDPKERFISFKVTTYNEFSVWAPSGYSIREQLARGRFFHGPQKYTQNENEVNENKIMLVVLNCTINKIDRYGENKTHWIYKCCFNYALSRLIVDNELEHLWRRENLDSPKFICYNRFFAKGQYRPSVLIFGKEPIEADEIGGIWVLSSP